MITNIKFNQENKTINLNQPKNLEIGSTKYLQEMIDILQNSNALPKEIIARGEVQEELKIDEAEIIEEETTEEVISD